MKLFFDFLPIALFFLTYKLYGIFAATVIAMLCSAIQIIYAYYYSEHLDKTQLGTFLIILLLGSATLFFHNPRFIQWKPTIIYWMLALMFLASHFFGKKLMVEYIMGEKITMPINKWRNMSYAFIVFFIAIGGANLFVAYHFSENTWVNFKLFGILGVTLCFLAMIALYANQFGEEVSSTLSKSELKKNTIKQNHNEPASS